MTVGGAYLSGGGTSTGGGGGGGGAGGFDDVTGLGDNAPPALKSKEAIKEDKGIITWAYERGVDGFERPLLSLKRGHHPLKSIAIPLTV